VRLLKHHVGSRCTLQLDLDDKRLALKAYAGDPAPLVALLHSFEREGLATGRPPTVPPLLGFDSSLRLIVTAWLHGPSGKDLIAGGAGPRTAELALAWLRTAAKFPIALGEQYGPSEVLGDTETRVRNLAQADSALGSLAFRQLERLASDPPTSEATSVRHASFKPSSLIDLNGPGVIDWDGFRRGPLELEAARFLSALSRMAKSRRAATDEIRHAERTFREGLAELVDADALGWYLTADLVKLAARLARRQPSGWLEKAQGLLADAGAVLDP
jgi:phosphotransferase family enzyme